jgi:hypothetical protein
MVTQFPTENPPLATVNTHLLRMRQLLQCHLDPSLTCPKPTGRTEGNPACKPSNGSAVPGGPSVQAALLSPEIGESWLSRRLSVPGRQKCTRPAVVAGGYHRGQRTGHVRTGVTRELGRASCFSAHESRKTRGTGGTRALASAWCFPSADEPETEHKPWEAGGVSGRERRAKFPEMGTGSLSGA